MSYQQFGHVDPEERLDYSEEPAPGGGGEEYYVAPRRLLPGALLAVGVMAVFAGGLWFAYHAGEKHAEKTAAVVADSPAVVPTTSGGAAANANAQVPLIRADTAPVKIKPDKAGGMNIPDRDDPIYAMQPSANPAEHILPPPEAPAPRPVAPPPAPPQVAAVPQAVAPAIEPGPVPLPAPGPSPVAAARPAPKPAPTAKPETAGPPIKVQLASLRTPDEARDEWQRVKRENSDLLGKYTASAVRSDLGDRGIWYRVEVGPVGDRPAALRLCKALRDRDLGCQLVP